MVLILKIIARAVGKIYDANLENLTGIKMIKPKYEPNDRNKNPYHYNLKATMKEVFKTIQIYLPKDYKFDREFANIR